VIAVAFRLGIPMKSLVTIGLSLLLGTSAAAQDVTAGAREFERQCAACHVVQTPGGDVLAGRNARTGPNLYGVVDAAVGGRGDFRYSDSLSAAGEAGRTWTREAFVAYAQDPNGWLRAELNDRRARGRMVYQVREPQTAVDLHAYLESLTQ
jgi:cytochrome c